MHIPTEPPCAYAALFDLERRRLLELLQPLSTSDWSRPTPCPGWSVLGLATHLLGGDLGLLARTRDKHHGTEPPQRVDEAGFISWLDQLQADWVNAARRLSPRIVVELLAWTGPQVSAMVSTQVPTQRTAMVSWASDQAVPVWLDQCRELSEWWIHRQQLREALGDASDLRVDVAGPVLAGLKWAYPYRLSVLDRPAGTTAMVEITGHGLDAQWTFASDASGWRPAGDAVRDPDARLTMTAEQAWRLLTNNLEVEELEQLSTGGDTVIVSVLMQTRAIIGTPK